MGTDTSPQPDSAIEPTAEILARAERWARGGRIEDALAACAGLLPRFAGRPDPVAQGTCEHVMALSHLYAGRVKDAVLGGYRAIALLEGTDAVPRQLQVLAMQAGGLARLGAAPEALELLDRAIRLLPQMADRPRERCVFWTNAAVVHHALGQLPQALEAAGQALALLDRFEEPDLHVVCDGNALTIRVALALQADPLDRAGLLHAVAGLEAWLHRCIADGRHHLVADSADAVADAYVALDERERAREWLERAVASARTVGAGPAQGQIEVRLARLDRLEGAHASAGEHLALAFQLLDEGQSRDALSAAHRERSELLEAQADWRGALASFKQHAQMREAALAAQADIRTQAMAMRLELERSRLDAELLRRLNEELQTSVSQLSDEAGEFRRQAMEDPLTGLANRRQMEAGVAQLARQYPDTPQILLIADIDHFKRINDTWSHAVGDEVLQAFAGLLRAQSRPHDVLARIGGEEFVVALGGAVSMTRALLVAERMRAAIEAHPWGDLQAGLKVSTSIGVAARAPGEPLNAALKRADAALYECKRSGRNQVRCAS